jgi:alpha-mannosidase
MAQKKTYHFISHTHWDREWYLPFERFRYRLVNLIDRLLELLDNDPGFKYFHLDGQTIVLEDYYALRPGNKQRLESYIKQGRILIGPWYQQNDLFLTSGESTVRNLMEGIRVSRELGGEMKIGYLPDHFGLIGQMPQIFQDIGLDNCVFGRGYDLAKHGNPFFYWQAPDGSNVTALMLYYWYNSAQRLPNDKEKLRSVFDGIREREEKINKTPHHAMMNGVDHLEAQYDLSTVLEHLREGYDDIEIVHDILPNYVKGVQSFMQTQHEGTYETIEGELREAFEYNILAGTLSSRIYIKQANLECHDLVEKWIEPLSVWCRMKDLDMYETDTIRYYWKLYMENHPHDSICGCSQDIVHDHMMDRFQRLKEVASEIIERKLTVLAKQISSDIFAKEDQKLVVANTSQLESSEVIKTLIYFLPEDEVDEFSIEDEEGNEVPYRVVSTAPSRIQILSPINLPGDLRVKRFEIEWKPEASALGYRAYRVRPHRKGKITDGGITTDHVMENDLLRVEIQQDGTFHLMDKKTGRVLKNQGRLEDAGDRGDLYVFKEVNGVKNEIWSDRVRIVNHISNELYDECTYQFTWHIPDGLGPDRATRTDNLVPCDFTITLRLDKATPYLKMKIENSNRVKDHRLRVLFPAQTAASYVLAGGQFDVVKRTWDQGKEFQRDANSQPFWKWFAPVWDTGGTAIFAKGLHEYEMLEEGRTAAVTIHRGVENISVREDVYSEHDFQPKAQCLGTNVVELAIRPFVKETSTQLYQEAEFYHQGVITKLYAIDEDRWSIGRAWVQDTLHNGLFKDEDPNMNKPRIPYSDSFLQLDGNVMVSALKWSEDGERPVLRLYNAEAEASAIELSSYNLNREVISVNLLEEPKSTMPTQNDKLYTVVDPKKIVTFKL